MKKRIKATYLAGRREDIGKYYYGETWTDESGEHFRIKFGKKIRTDRPWTFEEVKEKNKLVYMHQLDTSEPTGGKWAEFDSAFCGLGYMSGKEAMEDNNFWGERIVDVETWIQNAQEDYLMVEQA